MKPQKDTEEFQMNIVQKKKKSSVKGLHTGDSNYMTFQKLQNYGNNKKTGIREGGREEGIDGAQDSFRTEKIQYDISVVDISHNFCLLAHRNLPHKSEPKWK